MVVKRRTAALHNRRSTENLDQSNIKKAYARWAPFYDMVFGKVMADGRRSVVAAANRMGGRVLEVGVGTGIALPEYGHHLRVTGIDLSADMLVKAHQRVSEEGLHHVDALAVMDATRMGFADGAFDTAVAMFLFPVVPDPEAVLAEMARVVRPGGQVVLVNHFGAESGPRAAVEKMLAERAHILGWRPDFPIERVMGNAHLEMVEQTPVQPFGLFTVLRFVKLAAEGTEPAPELVAVG